MKWRALILILVFFGGVLGKAYLRSQDHFTMSGATVVAFAAKTFKSKRRVEDSVAKAIVAPSSAAPQLTIRENVKIAEIARPLPPYPQTRPKPPRSLFI
jgi:hypothetical protein